MNRRAAITLALLAGTLLLVILWRLSAGGPVWDLPPADRAAILDIRLARIATAGVVGLCLSVAGVLLQSLLRNPLASPDIMGMSSAASLGVVLWLFLLAPGSRSFDSISPWHSVPALLGALAALALVTLLSRRQGVIDPAALVLIGVVVSVMCGAGVLLVQHFMLGAATSPGAVRLLAGAISDEVPRPELLGVGALGVVATLVSARLGPFMDAASLGDDEAASVGVPIRSLRLALLALAGLLTAGAVMLAGPIGFIGLVAPHTVRLLAGPGLGGTSRATHVQWGGNRFLVLASALAGPSLVIAADALVRVLDFQSGHLPIGVVTALVGGATFIALLRAQRRA